jgi:hypothetical protein
MRHSPERAGRVAQRLPVGRDVSNEERREHSRSFLGRPVLRCGTHGSAERLDCRFGFSHQELRAITELVVLLHKALRGLARLPGPSPDLFREHRAIVEMSANALSQVRTTARTELLFATEQICGKLGRTVLFGARLTAGNCVCPTIAVEETAFLDAEHAGPLAVQVRYTPEGELDRIVR